MSYECGPAPAAGVADPSTGHYRWHQREGTPVCGLSRAENRAWSAAYYQRRKAEGRLPPQKPDRATTPYRERVRRRPAYARYKNTKKHLRTEYQRGRITAEERRERQSEAKRLYEADPYAVPAGYGVCGTTTCEHAEPGTSDCICACGGVFHAYHKMKEEEGANR